VEPGLRLSREDVAAHLERAGYSAVYGRSPGPGEFRLSERSWRIHRRRFHYPDGEDEGGLVVAAIDGRGAVSAVSDAAGSSLGSVLLEPELIGTLLGPEGEDRELVPLERIPAHVVDAVLVAEDRRFYQHPGIDPIRILGAARENLRERRIVEGASTLTQQLVKNVYLSPERSFSRKLREVGIALVIELRYSKDEILEAYLNQVYLGQDGGHAIHGVGRAARFYFGKPASELTVAEGALLAGMIRAPSALSPHRHPDRARERRDAVLGRMLAHERIDTGTHESASNASLRVKRTDAPARFAPHYLELVKARLADRFGEEQLERGGLRVFSALDGGFQRAAEASIAAELARLERGYPLLRRRGSPLQAALVALDPATGEILALVGGRDAEASSFDRATRAHRQPGSVFKPVVTLAALAGEQTPPITLATVLEDRPLELELPSGKRWAPRNIHGEYRGPVTLRTALEDSLNVPFARLGLEVGLVEVAETARRLGIESPLRPIPSLSLGAFEMTPLEVASAYAVLAAGGVRRTPHVAQAVVAPGGRALGGERVEQRRAFTAADSWLVTDALRGVVQRGTGKTLAKLGVAEGWAGKTGTSNDYRDAWFVGYGPDLVVVVWVGFDDGARVGLSGAQAALPIFARFIRSALGGARPRGVEAPPGLVVAEIDPSSGMRAGAGCTGREEYFAAGTLPPTRSCAEPAGALGWAARLLAHLR